MPNAKEEAVACDKNAKNAQPGVNREATEDRPLDAELGLLRDSLAQARQAMKGNDEDMAKCGALVARLSDSVARALLAQQKLLAGSDRASTPEEEFDDTLRAMGLGEF